MMLAAKVELEVDNRLRDEEMARLQAAGRFDAAIAAALNPLRHPLRMTVLTVGGGIGVGWGFVQTFF